MTYVYMHFIIKFLGRCIYYPYVCLSSSFRTVFMNIFMFLNHGVKGKAIFIIYMDGWLIFYTEMLNFCVFFSYSNSFMPFSVTETFL